MTIDETGSHPSPDDVARHAKAATISRALRREEQAQREADDKERILKVLVPDDVLDRLLHLWIMARRQDEGVTRPIKADHLVHQKRMARLNQPVMALLRAAYRAGLYDALYRSDLEERHDSPTAPASAAQPDPASDRRVQPGEHA